VAAVLVAAIAGAVPAPAPDQTTIGTDRLPPKGLQAGGLRITKKAHRRQRVVFSVAVPQAAAGEALVALGEYQVSFCSNDDIRGGGSRSSPCVGISRYRYTPRVSTRVVLAAKPNATHGKVLADWQTTFCRHATHHCPIPFRVSFGGDAGGGFVNVVATADSGGKNVDGDDLVDVEHKGKLDVIRIGATQAAASQSFGDDTIKQGSAQIPVVPNDPKRRVVFKVTVPDVKAGDVLEVHGKLRVSKPSNYRFNPLVTTKVSTKGGAVVGVNGPNCTGTCDIVDFGATRVAADSPKLAVRLYARAVRNDSSAGGGVVTLEGGSLTVIRHRGGAA
jgi:hypothetical protein